MAVKQAAFLVALISSIALIVSGSNSNLVKVQDDEKEITVFVGDKGSSPQNISISEGTKVIFKSQSEKPMWPASDSHPSHLIYPEFDPKRPIRGGGEWAFIFNKAGRFEYHDHLNPLFVGVIEVRSNGSQEEVKIDTKRPEECLGGDSVLSGGALQDQMGCWRESLRFVIRNDGFASGIKAFEKLYGLAESFRKHCHVYAHVLGEEAYWQIARGKDIPWTEMIDRCDLGFYHGFMQEMVSHGRDIEISKDFCDSINKKFSGPEKELRIATCYHGVGHGLVYEQVEQYLETGAEDIVRNSINFCEKIQVSDYVRNECVAGIFGGIESLYFGVHGLRIPTNPEDPFEICHSQLEKYRRSCYNALVPYARGAVGAERLIGLINKISHEPSLAIASEHAGYVFGRYELDARGGELRNATKLCEGLIQRFMVVNCIKGIAMSFVQGGYLDTVNRAMGVCRESGLNAEELKLCATGVIRRVEIGFSEDQVKEVCDSLAAEHRDLCRSIVSKGRPRS